MVDIEKRQADRLRVMKAIFDASDGSEFNEVRGDELADKLVDLTQQELADACRYLKRQGLIEEAMPDMGGSPVPYWVNITHPGIMEMEQSLGAPDKPTEHFPPISVITISNSNVIGSAIQSGSPGAHQEMTVGDINIEGIREFLNELESHTADLELPEAEGQEFAAEIATVKAQIDSPRPKKQIIRESLHTIRSILEGIGGNLAAAPLLELLKHIL